MDRWLRYYFLSSIVLIPTIADGGHVRILDAQQDERVRLECTVTSKLDAEEVCREYRFFLRLNDFTFTGGASIF